MTKEKIKVKGVTIIMDKQGSDKTALLSQLLKDRVYGISCDLPLNIDRTSSEPPLLAFDRYVDVEDEPIIVIVGLTIEKGLENLKNMIQIKKCISPTYFEYAFIQIDRPEIIVTTQEISESDLSEFDGIKFIHIN